MYMPAPPDTTPKVCAHAFDSGTFKFSLCLSHNAPTYNAPTSPTMPLPLLQCPYLYNAPTSTMPLPLLQCPYLCYNATTSPTMPQPWDPLANVNQNAFLWVLLLVKVKKVRLWWTCTPLITKQKKTQTIPIFFGAGGGIDILSSGRPLLWI